MTAAHTAPRGHIEVRPEQSPVLVTMTGDIDMKTVTEAARARLSLAETDGEIAVDVSQVDFIDSLGLTVLLELRHYARDGVRLLHPKAELLRLLDVTGIDALFTIEP